MTINGVMKYSDTFEKLSIGDIFSFEDERRKIWNSMHQYSTHEEYEEKDEKDWEEYKKNHDNYLGEDLYMLCWHSVPEFVDDEVAFHPKYISLKDGCMHDMIEEQEFIDHNYYSEVRVYDTCRKVEPDFDDIGSCDEWA